jgi:hypothetical protein
MERELQILKRQVLFLSIYALIITVAGVLFWVRSFQQNGQTIPGEARFNTLSAQRINIVEPDGTIKLALFNSHYLPAAIINGVKLPRSGGGESGLMFYNGEGVECGGLIYGGKKADGNERSGMSLSMDRYKGDQEIQLYHDQELDSSRKNMEENALIVADRPDLPLDRILATIDSIKTAIPDTAAQRLALRQMKASGYFGLNRLIVGKKYDQKTGVFINDASGKPRLNIFVDAEGKPHIQFLDDKGAVTTELPEK